MEKSVISALLDLKKTVPNMSWHLEGDVLVVKAWLTVDDAELLRQGQRMFAPR